jgi:hypothetical protein
MTIRDSKHPNISKTQQGICPICNYRSLNNIINQSEDKYGLFAAWDKLVFNKAASASFSASGIHCEHCGWNGWTNKTYKVI